MIPTHSGREETYARDVLPEIDVLLRVARSLTDQRADAEDLVQDTLLRAWRFLDTFDGRNPRAWLLTILRNAHLNSVRKQRPGLLHDPDAAAKWQASAESSMSAEDSVVLQGFDARVETALAALPEDFRRAVLLVDVSGLDYATAAAFLEVPEGTVMSRVHRARKRIRAALASSAGESP